MMRKVHGHISSMNLSSTCTRMASSKGLDYQVHQPDLVNLNLFELLSSVVERSSNVTMLFKGYRVMIYCS